MEACRKGFYSAGKQRFLCHNLVDLLRQLSRAFDNVSNAVTFAASSKVVIFKFLISLPLGNQKSVVLMFDKHLLTF